MLFEERFELGGRGGKGQEEILKKTEGHYNDRKGLVDVMRLIF